MYLPSPLFPSPPNYLAHPSLLFFPLLSSFFSLFFCVGRKINPDLSLNAWQKFLGEAEVALILLVISLDIKKKKKRRRSKRKKKEEEGEETRGDRGEERRHALNFDY